MTLSTPGPTLGVVGGGLRSDARRGRGTAGGRNQVVTDPTPDPPAAPVVRDALVGAFDDDATFRELAERADVLTYEIELADPDVLERVAEETGTPVHPDPETLRTIQDKLVQKRRLSAAGVPVPEFRQVDSAGTSARPARNWVTRRCSRLARAATTAAVTSPSSHPTTPSRPSPPSTGRRWSREMVDFERELAVMGCRGADGQRDTFPVTETIHREEILRESVSPPRTDDDAVLGRAREIVLDVLDAMDGRGVFGVELFETTDGGSSSTDRPRPH